MSSSRSSSSSLSEGWVVGVRRSGSGSKGEEHVMSSSRSSSSSRLSEGCAQKEQQWEQQREQGE